MQTSFPSFAALTLLSDMFTCQMFCIFRTVTGILTVVTVRILIYSSNSSEIEDPPSNFKIMPSLFSSISFLRLNPKNVFSQQINVLPLYTATLGFRHSYCTQTYNVLLQTQWCRHSSVWLCIGLVQKCNYLSQGESGPIVWTPQPTGYTYGAISCTAVSNEFAARNGQAIVTLRCVLF